MKNITIQPLFKYSILLSSILRNTRDQKENYFMSGRYAFEYSLIELMKNTKEFTTIYLPNLICEEVVTIVENLNLNIEYYDINNKLEIDIKELEERLTNELSVLLIVNYFGFPSQWIELNKMKNRKNCIFIEDNAHSLYSSLNNKDLGTFGDISFNSFRKLLPLLSGSQLRSNSKNIVFKRNLESRFPNIDEIRYSLRQMKNFFPKISSKKSLPHPPMYIPPKPIDNFSKRVLDSYIFDKEKIKRLRHKNYKFWHEYLKDSDLIFFTKHLLHKDICPYVFPCYTNSRDIITKWIHWGASNNINIISWPKYHTSTVPFLKDDFKQGILCFPVNHQFDLTRIIG